MAHVQRSSSSPVTATSSSRPGTCSKDPAAGQHGGGPARCGKRSSPSKSRLSRRSHRVQEVCTPSAFDGWTPVVPSTASSRATTGHDGPGWIPDDIIADMDMEGVRRRRCSSPTLALFVLFTDDHELSMAHSRAWNDWVAETYLQYKDRMRPVASIPMTNIPERGGPRSSGAHKPSACGR